MAPDLPKDAGVLPCLQHCTPACSSSHKDMHMKFFSAKNTKLKGGSLFM